MRILIAEDDRISRRLLEVTLQRQGHEVVVTADGEEAWAELQKEDAPRVAVLDWMMPGIDGVDLIRRVRGDRQRVGYRYLILLTAKGQKADLVTGLDAGADDYLTKPFDSNELRSRLAVGERILTLQQNLASKVHELQEAMQEIRTLHGLLPICMHCKKIRDERDVWHRIENYISERSDANFSHSLCGECLEIHYPQASKSASGLD